MHRGQLLALVSAVWVISELVVALAKHARSDDSRRDRGSLIVLWIAIGGATFAAAFLAPVVRATRMPPEAFWIGLGLMIARIVFRAIAIATLWRHFRVDVAISPHH